MSEENTTICSQCEETISEEDSQTNENGYIFCQECYDDTYISCEKCGCEIVKEDAKEVNGYYYCESCFDDNFSECSHCGDIISNDNCYSSDNGDSYCNSCYIDLFTHCYGCGDEILIDNAICHDDRWYCPECVPPDDNWESKRFTPSDEFGEIGSFRRFGVELETSKCPNHTDIEDDTCFGCKDDGSINGKEFVSPILSSDKGLEEIEKFCTLAREYGFDVDKDCGFHLHLDVLRQNKEDKRRIAYAYQLTEQIWQSFVARTRALENDYCKPINYNASKELPETRSRYHWVNLCSIDCHNTIEIRLHTSTLDATKICNWIKAHLRFADWAVCQDNYHLEEGLKDGFDSLSEIWNDESLTEFYRNRAQEFGTTYPIRQKVIA